MTSPNRRRILAVLASALLALVLLPAAGGGPAAQEYTIGPGDILKITVWGQDDLSKDYPVTLDGRVPFPLIGSVQAAGLSTTELARRLRELLEKDYLVNPQVLVSVKEYLSSKVHVVGEAEKPGLFYLSGPTTLLELLSRPGACRTPPARRSSSSAPTPRPASPAAATAPCCSASTCGRSRRAT